MTNLLPKPFYLILELIDFQDFPRRPFFFQGFSLNQGRIQSLNELAYVYPHHPPRRKNVFTLSGGGSGYTYFHPSIPITSTLLLHPIVFLLQHTPQEFQFKYRKICYELDLYIYPMASLTFSLLIIAK